MFSLDQVGIAEFHQHPLGADGNKGAGGLDEDVTGAHCRRGGRFRGLFRRF